MFRALRDALRITVKDVPQPAPPAPVTPLRDTDGRFISDERARIRNRTAWMRSNLNPPLPPLEILQPNRDKFDDQP